MKLTLAKVLKAADYQITGGCNYLWSCYGPNSYTIDCGNFTGIGRDPYWELSVKFDRKNQIVYEVCIIDVSKLGKLKVWRWVNQKYLSAVKDEHKERGLNFKFFDESENLKFVDVNAEKMLLTIQSVVAKHNKKRS